MAFFNVCSWWSNELQLFLKRFKVPLVSKCLNEILLKKLALYNEPSKYQAKDLVAYVYGWAKM